MIEMNSSKRTSNIKTRLTSAIVVAALIICAVISFGFINIPRVGLADDDTSVKAVHGIRFAQVAAGEDFAIGLTSDGQLYGWSLLASRANETSFANPTLVDTLGKYYPGIPARLDVKFYVGPGRNDASPLFWSNDGYHVSNETTADEKIDRKSVV